MAKKRTSGVEREERFITIKWGGGGFMMERKIR
jgi:hypothetical protein